ncbi:MAG TPA: hypothetical protein VG126_07895 [Thermoleophilaceae bacterium]|nr:hypothetical protein [Thermoleophilaceae bacterium]
MFGFFADAFNLEAITPAWLRFRVVTPGPIAMAPGTLIEYRLRLHGVPVRWLTRIELWEPLRAAARAARQAGARRLRAARPGAHLRVPAREVARRLGA